MSEPQKLATAEDRFDTAACALSLLAIGIGIGGATSWGWGLAAAGGILLTVTLLSRIDFRRPPKGETDEPV